MKAIQSYMPFLASALLMCVVLCIIYPHYQYYIDPDGTAYLTIAQRYANGDYARAVNGYWSPWGCWLTALLIKADMAAIPASVVVNAAGGIGFMGISLHLFRLLGIQERMVWILQVTLALFLCYAVFWQSFDDLWQAFFLMCALCLLLNVAFETRFHLWVLYGVVGALAYFSKAYAFPFLIASTAYIMYLLSPDRKSLFMVLGVSFGTMLLCMSPWLLALHSKYGTWTTSTAGTLNMSWYLTGHPEWKDGIHLLIPPAYADSPYYWEDPFLANGATPHFWSSLHLFGLQLARIVMNLWKLLKSMLLLSIFFPFAVLDLIGVIRKFLTAGDDEESALSPDFFVMSIVFFLFMGGYLIINFEPRYLWYLLPMVMAVQALAIQNLTRPKFRRVMSIIMPLSFLIYPAVCMVNMYNEGRQEHRMAEQLQQLNVHGTFASAVFPGREAQGVERLAFFSDNAYYSLSRPNYTMQELLQEMRRYHVRYYFAYSSAGSKAVQAAFTDEGGKPFPEVTNGVIEGLRVYLVNP